MQQTLGFGAAALSGIDPLHGADTAPAPAQAFRFAFLTDFHLFPNNANSCRDGIISCLEAVEKLDPKPEFILAGGDLVHDARSLTVGEAETRLDEFLKLWHDHTSLPTQWVFGNHDLVAVNDLAVPPGGPHYGKGLFMDRLKLPHLFYSFDIKGWHFIVLDDIALQPDRTYKGEFFAEELAFLRADLDAHKTMPTIVCAHIPVISALPLSLYLAKATGLFLHETSKLVCTNGNELLNEFPRHNIRAVLAGHLHHYETTDVDNVRFINSGAVCGNYWCGPMLDCPEGFGIADLGADGSFKYKYRSYGWKAPV